MFPLRPIVVAGLIVLAAPAISLAQPLGTFRWQIQPYCNILSLSVVQQGGLYLLNGNDDQCAAPQQASVVGLAFQNPDGTIGFGLTVVSAPGGTPVHIDATITLATLGGTWRDSNGNNGTFIFTPGAGIGGSPRPALSGPRAAFAGGDQTMALAALDTVVRSVTLTAPAAGTVIVNASGYIFFTSAATDIARCSVTTGTTLDSAAIIFLSDFGVPASQASVPIAGTRGFSVAAGAFTVNLVCDVNQGSASVADTHLTAIFVAGS